MLLRGVDAVAAAGKAFGVAIPMTSREFNADGARVALWLGPDEWLLIAPEEETPALQAKLEAALSGIAHSLVDISHRQTALAVEGRGAELLLNAGVPLDISLAAFPVGAVVRTIFEKAEIILWRQQSDSFHVEVWRSFAPYVCALLEAARADNSSL
ncbi:sarcosine oxidase subunit gamma [Bradyrhizobium sp. WU425]|uniref:sarcosine oxidase subunit gamma n=1 Tax=Bradyrhizobium sp. WU425 TaxID=187029 RepID=UPI001E464B56|nr:sarcosine oxidase subunit gamma family protein [Bradyrhizobium canariense]UFW71405.1 sarcosine oxidase subunit gamma family protein [Bradyrhizobium canariense]